MVTPRSTEMFNDARFTIFVLESVGIQVARMASGGYLQGNMEPLAVIVRSADEISVLDMLGNPRDLTAIPDVLRQQIIGTSKST
ncbi:MAG: hypothetical protein OEQ74_08795 [Gammaproteobacteria bacterium]|nr:hypothetical protein [Gammaproteobacteria bacterium]